MLLIALHGSKPHSIYLAEHPEYLIFIFDLTVQKIKDMFWYNRSLGAQLLSEGLGHSRPFVSFREAQVIIIIVWWKSTMKPIAEGGFLSWAKFSC